MSKRLDRLVKQAAAAFGHELQSEVSFSDGFFRPKTIKTKNGLESTSLSFWIIDESILAAQDWSGDVSSNVKYYDLASCDEMDKVPQEARDAYNEKLNSEKHAKRQSFVGNLKERGKHKDLEPQDHVVFKDKKLRYNKYSSAYVDANGCLIVPFYIGADVSGAQIRRGLKDKFAVKSSSFRGACHIVQPGLVDPVFNNKNVFLVESYTTACELAEARPDDKVVCTAGIINIKSVYLYLTTVEKEYNKNIIVVCDKDTSGSANKHLIDQMSWLWTNKIPYIQMPIDDDNCLGLSDYNEYALRYGKNEAKRFIHQQVSALVPSRPEVLSKSDGTYVIVAPTTRQTVQMSAKVFMTSGNTVVSQGFWDFHESKLGMEPTVEYWQKYLDESLIRSKGDTRGLGVYKDKGFIVANTKLGKYVYDGETIDMSLEMKPTKGANYVDCATVKSTPNLPLSTPTVLKKTIAALHSTYNLTQGQSSIIMSWLFQAMVSPSLRTRAHLWMTGTSGSGKTLFINNFINRLCNPLSISLIDSTAEGINQLLSEEGGISHSPILAYDEAAADTDKKRGRMVDIIQIARNMATAGGETTSVRGTKDLDGKEYKAKCAMLLSSVTSHITDMQDLSRFIEINMEKTLKLTKDRHFRDLEKTLEGLSLEFLSLCIRALPLMNEAIDEASEQFSEVYSKYIQKMSHRSSTLVNLIAGFSAICAVESKHSLKEITTKVLKVMQPEIKALIQEVTDFNRQGRSLVDTLCVSICTNRDKEPLLEALCYETMYNDPDSRFKKYYGLSLFVRSESVFLDIEWSRTTKARIEQLEDNKELVNFPKGLYDLIYEHKNDSPNSCVSAKRDGKSVRVIRLPLPDKFNSLCLAKIRDEDT